MQFYSISGLPLSLAPNIVFNVLIAVINEFKKSNMLREHRTQLMTSQESLSANISLSSKSCSRSVKHSSWNRSYLRFLNTVSSESHSFSSRTFIGPTDWILAPQVLILGLQPIWNWSLETSLDIMIDFIVIVKWQGMGCSAIWPPLMQPSDMGCSFMGARDGGGLLNREASTRCCAVPICRIRHYRAKLV
jgi:hypothetical protein